MINNPNEELEQWYCSFNNVLEIHMPFKTRRIKIQHQPVQFSVTISSAIKKRKNLQMRAIKFSI